MYIAGMDTMGGSSRKKSDGTTWEEWWKEVKSYLKHEIDGVKEQYRKLYDKDETVNDAFIIMY